MLLPQLRHLPPKIIKLTSGILSYQAICVWQLGQQERCHLSPPLVKGVKGDFMMQAPNQAV